MVAHWLHAEVVGVAAALDRRQRVASVLGGAGESGAAALVVRRLAAAWVGGQIGRGGTGVGGVGAISASGPSSDSGSDAVTVSTQLKVQLPQKSAPWLSSPVQWSHCHTVAWRPHSEQRARLAKRSAVPSQKGHRLME